MSKKGQRNGVSVSLKNQRKSCSESSQKILFWWIRSPRTSSTKSSTSYYKLKIQFRENYIWMSATWRSKIWNEEIQNAHYFESQRELEAQRWQLLEASKLNVREYICVANWRWRTIFIKNAMQEDAEKLKNFKRRCCQEENTENNEDRKNFLRSMIHEQWVYSSAILTCWAVMTDLRSSSSSYHLDFGKAKPRSWNAAKYTR